MFQRRQSVFMLLAIAALVISYFVPFAYIDQIETLQLRTYGVKDNSGQYLTTVKSYWFHLPLALAVGITGWALLLFKDRKRQIVLLRTTFFLYAVSFILLALYVADAQNVYSGVPIEAGPAFILPPLALILNWLAARNIRKDEELVRSVDRIR